MKTIVSTCLLLMAAFGFAGRSFGYSVALPDAPKPWEATAARELKACLQQLAADGRVSVEGVDVEVFRIGDDPSLKDEEWRIARQGKEVRFSGGGTRGTLYAVYHFLEDDCGVRWWRDGDEDVPAGRELKLGTIDRGGRPFFRYRDIFRDPKSSPLTAVRNRVNGNGDAKIPAEFGGGCEFGPPYHCHTWDRYLPWEKFGKEHPEWYSLTKDGERRGGQNHGQLCLTCPGLPRVLADAMEPFIARGRAAAVAKGLQPPTMYDMSENDNEGRCLCENCKALREKGGVAGELLHFENQVAAILAERHPELKFSVFAYGRGEPVPKDGTRAADNLIVKLCNTRKNMGAGFFDADTSDMPKLLKAWNGFAKNLFVWEYDITYKQTSGYPLPSEFGIGERMRYYADNGVMGILDEFEKPDLADFHDLKFRLISKLLENPYADEAAIRADFYGRYFGPAGEVLCKMRDHLRSIRRERKAFVTWFATPGEFSFIRAADIKMMTDAWAEAEKRVAGDEKRMARVARARRGFDILAESRAKAAAERRRSEPGVSDTPFANVTVESENVSFFRKQKAETLVDDPLASTGKAMFCPFADSKLARLPFQMGLFDHLTKKEVVKKGWAKPIGEGYQWYELPVAELPAAHFCYLTRSWCIQAATSDIALIGRKCRIKARIRFDEKGLYFDRIVFIPETTAEPKISVFGWHVIAVARERHISLAEAARLLRAEGVTGFDHSYTDKKRLKELADTGLKPVSLFGFVGMLEADGGEAKMRDFVDTAVEYGVPRIMILPDHFPGGVQDERVFAKIVERTAALVALAKSKGIEASVESFGTRKNCCCHSRYIKRLLTAVPDLKFTLDTGNLQFGDPPDDIVELARFAGPRIVHVHLKDLDPEMKYIGKEKIAYVTLGTGCTPNAECVKLVRSLGYDGWYTLENMVGPDTLEDLKRQVSVLRTWIGGKDAR